VTHLVIDGYNFINRRAAGGVHGDSSLETLRRGLLEKLSRYKKERGAHITVVFDAYKSFSLSRQRESYRGVDVIYSGQNETADDVIIGWIRQKRSGMVVVTSDRAIIDEAKAKGIPFLTPVKLSEMMAQTVVSPGQAKDEDEYEASYQGKKKGNPRKLPKKLRKVVKTIDKL